MAPTQRPLQLPPNQPQPSRTNRSASLSHARSPSALISTSYFPQDIESELYDSSSPSSPKLHHHIPLKALHTHHPSLYSDNIPNIKSPGLNIKTVSFVPMDQVVARSDGEESEVDENDGEDLEMDGNLLVSPTGFQKPDSLEMLGVVVSFSLVLLLAVSAGATTIYDWVF